MRGLVVSVAVVLLAAGCLPREERTLVVDAGPDQAVAVGAVAQLAGSVSGASGATHVDVSVAWAFVQRPVGSTALLVDPERFDARFVADVAGDFVLELRVARDGLEASDSVTITAVSEGVLLPGDPDALALDATYDMWVPMVGSDADVSVEEREGVEVRVLRSELLVGFGLDATVAEVNALLVRERALIVDMLPQQRQVIMRIPDPGSLEALYALVAALEADDLVDFVLPSVALEVDAGATVLALPSGLPGDLERVDHHLAVRAHAAWNLRGALPPFEARPWFVIADLFGDGPPEDGYDAVVWRSDYEPDRRDSKHHGYHVLGIAVGAFDPVLGLDDDRDHVTGMVPVTTRVRAVDLRAWWIPALTRQAFAVTRRINTILAIDPDARIIVNTSLNDRGHPFRKTAARSWVEMVRGPLSGNVVGAGLETRFVHLTSAGNVDPKRFFPGTTDVVWRWAAADNSFWAYAALGDMSRLLASDYPNLSNVHVVENRVQTRHRALDPDTNVESRPLPGCAVDGSIMGGTLSAIGTGVWSFGTTGGSSTSASRKTGTSMSTPQAAGLAALVWALDPSLDAPEVVALLRDTALPAASAVRTRAAVTCNAAAAQPVIDAYAAVLAAGGDRARLALLDLDVDGRFDERDLEQFLAAYAGRGQVLDYGRMDLSGDGRSGETRRSERFDLSGDGAYGSVDRTILDANGRAWTVRFDEAAVNDYDVLCYYAYSPLYGGDAEARNALVGNLCTGAPLVLIERPNEGESFAGTALVPFRARLEPFQRPSEVIEDYTIYWSYQRDSGEVVRLGTSASGETIEGRSVCAETSVTARAVRRSTPLSSAASVTYRTSNPQAGPWQARITTPAAHTYHVEADDLTAGVGLAGEARRMRCSGDETSTSGLTWLDEADELLGSGATLTLSEDFFQAGTARTVTLRYSSGPTETKVRIVPCSTQPASGLFACPELWPELRDAMLDRHTVLAELLDPDLMRERIEADLDVLLGGGAATPFPLPIPQLLAELDANVSSALGSRVRNLLETVTSGNLAAFEAGVRELASRVAEEQDLAAPELALLAQAIDVATVAAAVYAPLADGGADGWQYFPFAGMDVIAEADPLGPVDQALRGFLSGYLATRSGGFGVGAYDLARSQAAGIDGAVLGALDALAVGGD